VPEPSASPGTAGQIGIRTVGPLTSGDRNRPIFGAGTVIAQAGRIPEIGG